MKEAQTKAQKRNMRNAMSIDLEDWFCVHNLSQAIKKEDWGKCELRAYESTKRILNLLDKHRTRATFFVLGWVAERLPELICEIERKGHEIAVHGYNHLLLTEITPHEFEEDLSRALETLENCGVKQHPIGFRAPSFNIVEKTKKQSRGLCGFSKNIVLNTTRRSSPSAFIQITEWRMLLLLRTRSRSGFTSFR